jgi:CopA family copper-resistance protein
MPKDVSSLDISIDRRTLMRWGFTGAAMSLLPLYTRANGRGAAVRNALAQSVDANRAQKHYDLTIGKTAVNFSGKSAQAVTVNGTVPGPLLHLREGETVSIAVTNTLPEITSVHWHGLIIPNDQDGVPGITFPGIHQGETFHYQFTPRQNGTYWYHSHAILQEPAGFYGPLIIASAEPEPFSYDREYVVLLSDWNDTPPEKVLANLKKVDGYYNYRRVTLLDLRKQLSAAKSAEERAAIWRERLMWSEMRMDPTDITDSGPEWQFLMHGQTIENNWTALFDHGERIRLRIINGASMNFFDFSIPDLPMTIVAADGQYVQPIEAKALRIGIGETYDVIVAPKEHKAYTLFAATTGRIGFARGTLAPAPLSAEMAEAPIPALGPRPILTMGDMAGVHAHASHSTSDEISNTQATHSAHDHSAMHHAEHDHHAMPMSNSAASSNENTEKIMSAAMSANDESAHATGHEHTQHEHAPTETAPIKSVEKLNYADLRALMPFADNRISTKTIEMKLTGDMHRYFWTINDKKMSESAFFDAKRNERLRFVITNTTMMEHPMHVHGAFFQVENEQGQYAPRKHTLIIEPGQSVNLLTSFEEVGVWMIHCHLAYHALTGMMQAIVITEGART